MISIKKKFGKRIKELRKSKNMTQEQLAGLLGIEPPNVSKLESGMHFPMPENIEKLAKILDIDVKELFDFGHLEEKKYLIEMLKNYIDNAEENEIKFLYKTILNIEQFKHGK